MKKTTIQKLIEEMEYRIKFDKNVDGDQLIYNLKILLEDEKQLLIDTYNAGLVSGYNYTASGQQYYKSTFVNQNLKESEQ